MQCMAANIIDIKHYSPKFSDLFFFDNNIWMYLFCPLGNYQQHRQKAYSNFLKDIQTSRSTIFINSLILSEFTNRYLRMDFEQWKKSSGEIVAEFKKDFIGSTRYNSTVEEIKIHINRILKICEKKSDNFNAVDMEKVISHLKHIDFNDSYYLEYAQMNKMKIVTDDSDFTKYRDHNNTVITICK